MYSDPAPLILLLFDQLRLADAGASVRALLPAGSLGIIDARVLEQETPTLPVRPFLAFRAGAAQLDGLNTILAFTWWVYDDPGMGDLRLTQLVQPVIIAYDRARSLLPRPLAAIRVDGSDEARPDRSLALRTRPIRFTAIS